MTQTAESEEQVQEAWDRWVDLMPLADPELDGLICWATQQAGERNAGSQYGGREAVRAKNGANLTVWERQMVRLLLAGRAGHGQRYTSPPDGLINQRWREMRGEK